MAEHPGLSIPELFEAPYPILAVFFALMIADSVKFLVHTGVSAWLLQRGMQGYGDQRLIRTAVRTALAAAGMGVLTFGAVVLLETRFTADALNQRTFDGIRNVLAIPREQIVNRVDR